VAYNQDLKARRQEPGNLRVVPVYFLLALGFQSPGQHWAGGVKGFGTYLANNPINWG
jgi:hypothetical protein